MGLPVCVFMGISASCAGKDGSLRWCTDSYTCVNVILDVQQHCCTSEKRPTSVLLFRGV